jgi:hypothetical protein
MRAMIKLLLVSIALLVATGCEKNVKEGVNQVDTPPTLASAQ